MDQICEYMRNEKNLADIEDARSARVKKEAKALTQAARNKKRVVQEINATGDSNTEHEVEQADNYNQCRRHPNHPHTWEECYLNPRNPNNKLKNKKQKRSEQGNASTSNNNNQANPQQAPGGSRNSHEIDSIYLRSIPKSNTSTYVRVPTCSNPNPEKEGWKQPNFEEEGINHIYKCQR